jgi:hypothetical protein
MFILQLYDIYSVLNGKVKLALFHAIQPHIPDFFGAAADALSVTLSARTS